MSYIDRVYSIVKQIPKGKVATYGQIAARVNSLSASTRVSAQMVGWVLHANKDPGCPCHRVVNRYGRVAPGYAFGGPGEQRRKLLLEGVVFKDLERVDLAF